MVISVVVKCSVCIVEIHQGTPFFEERASTVVRNEGCVHISHICVGISRLLVHAALGKL